MASSNALTTSQGSIIPLDRLIHPPMASVYISTAGQKIKIIKTSSNRMLRSQQIDAISAKIATRQVADQMHTIVVTASYTAGSRVAHMPEILANILVRTIDATGTRHQRKKSKQQLLANQRVCKAFRDTIAGWSVPLRRALCFGTPNLVWDERSVGCNELLLDRFRGLPLGDGSEIDVAVACGTVQDRGLQKADLSVTVTRRGAKEGGSGAPAKEASWKQMKLRRDDHWVKGVEVKGFGCDKKMVGVQNPTMGQLVDLVWPELA